MPLTLKQFHVADMLAWQFVYLYFGLETHVSDNFLMCMQVMLTRIGHCCLWWDNVSSCDYCKRHLYFAWGDGRSCFASRGQVLSRRYLLLLFIKIFYY